MNTSIPTSDSGVGASPLDIGMLTRLAGEFFAALPGQAPSLSRAPGSALPAPPSAFGGVPLPANVLPGGTSLGPLANGPQLPGTLATGANVVPTSPLHAGAQVASVPSLVPHSFAPNGLPDNAAIVPPAVDGRAGSFALGVPEAYAAALPANSAPSAGGATQPASPSPYYFLGESSGYPKTSTTASPPARLPSDLVSAQSFGLPGADALRGLLQHDRRANAPTATDSAGPFYFIEPDRNPHGPTGKAPNAEGYRRGADASSHPPFDVNAIRRDFPILQERVNGRQLVWFDNAATTQKPQSVIDRLSHFYAHENSNIHRAAHALAARATDAYEGARQKVARFLGASSTEEIIFVRGATEGINLVAKTWGAKNVGEGDEIIVSQLEHHANIVPWQQLAAEKGAKIRVIPVDDSGQVLLEEYRRLLGPRTKIVAVTQVSNALGTVVPVAEIVALAHRAGAAALVDGAQSVSHMAVDVQQLDADFFVFSGHKVFGPTGIGVVYGKRAILEDMPPWQGGGNMIADVTFERTVYHGPPTRFEAGTGNIADAVGLGAAIAYVERLGMANIHRYEHDLLAYATAGMQPIKGLRLIGTARNKASVLSFVLDGFEPETVGKALNEEGIAVRSGHHCAQPILRRFGLEATVRPSLAFYNTCEEVDRMVAVVRRLAGGGRR
jgi:cysteine desulfurase/selenocysteine lyase